LHSTEYYYEDEIKEDSSSWVEHVACMGDKRNTYILWSENLKGSDHLAGLGVDGRILLE
jgi:hypothetical protein